MTISIRCSSASLCGRYRKTAHSAEARVRAIAGIGLELRFSIPWEPLEQAAREKRADFEEKGWRGRLSLSSPALRRPAPRPRFDSELTHGVRGR